MRTWLAHIWKPFSRATRDAECTSAGGERMTLVRVHCWSAISATLPMTAAQGQCSSETGGQRWHRHAYGSRLSKNGGIRAEAFGDGAVLTCLGNDFGYADVFRARSSGTAARAIC